MDLIVEPTGKVRCLYDELIPLQVLGSVDVRRASHVEPDAHGEWLADLAPMGGPVLGPFLLRTEALTAERRWLEEHWLPTVLS